MKISFFLVSFILVLSTKSVAFELDFFAEESETTLQQYLCELSFQPSATFDENRPVRYLQSIVVVAGSPEGARNRVFERYGLYNYRGTITNTTGFIWQRNRAYFEPLAATMFFLSCRHPKNSTSRLPEFDRAGRTLKYYR